MAIISDQELLNAFHQDPKYNVTYANGVSYSFNANNLTHAKTLAREYGIRFLGGTKVLILQWVKE